ncbi:MAG: UdgX family uracil-DNA binding protein [Gammaproteobacteria bacterium]
MSGVEVELESPADYRAWRDAARELLNQGISPDQVSFRLPFENGDLFAEPLTKGAVTPVSVRVPRAFQPLAEQVICHSDGARFALLYRVLWRLQSAPRLLDDASDDDVWQLHRMAKAVRRDAHKMKAFVRFRQVPDGQREVFIAWFEPDHHIVEFTAPFFKKRFAGMHWSIVTPSRSVHWDKCSLRFGDGATRADCPDADALESWWRTYYASIFNPARLKVKAMGSEMPKKYWHNLPESRLIGDLVRDAHRYQLAAPTGTRPSVVKAKRLVSQQRRTAPEPEPVGSLQELVVKIRACERCSLHQCATQAVVGAGPDNARLMVVGEQPGDQEDVVGKPFVGPAGVVLNRAFNAANIERDDIYLTNAVKHFKYRARGRQRLHVRPDSSEIEHCRWWLTQERSHIDPDITLALGATAAHSLLGHPCRIKDVRGRLLQDDNGRKIIVTVHPSYLLRLGNSPNAQLEYELFVRDLKLAHNAVSASKRPTAV